MKRKVFVLFLLVAILLAGCTIGGPSNAQAKKIINNVFLRKARIVEKKQCPLTPRMQEGGHTNVWLVKFRFKDTKNENGVLLTETGSKDTPWEIYLRGIDICPPLE